MSKNNKDAGDRPVAAQPSPGASIVPLSAQAAQPPASRWATPPPPKEWGVIKLNGSSANLPPPGDYLGVIAEVRLYDKGDTLWLSVGYVLPDFDAIPAPDLAAIAAAEGSKYAGRVPDGARLLHRLARATCQTLPDDLSPDDIRARFEGALVMLTVAHRTRDGVPELLVREIRPR